jgi:hypothetical protein
MNNPISMGRRSFIRGLPLATAAIALPASAFAAHAGVAPTTPRDPTEGYTPLQRAKYHSSMAMKAMAEHAGGDWTFAVDTEAEFILIRRIPDWTWVPTDIPGLSVPSPQYFNGDLL